MKIDGISMTDILISWKYRENVKRLSLSGADPEGGAPGARPTLKLEKI